MNAPIRVLIIEDDPACIELIREELVSIGYLVDHTKVGSEGLRFATNRSYSLIILDINLPEINGFEICKRLRQSGKTVPILILSASIEEVDKLLGLELGADDYVTKPFNVHEVRARVRGILRRSAATTSQSAVAGETLKLGDIELQMHSRLVTRLGKRILLTPCEYHLLHYLLERRGTVVKKEELLKELWQEQTEQLEKALTMHIGRLRAKIDSPARPSTVRTIRGVGYTIDSNS